MAKKNKRGGARLGSGREAKFIEKDRLTINLEASTKKALRAKYPGWGAINNRLIELINKDLNIQ